MPRTTRELRKRRHARVRAQVTGTAARPRVAVFRSHKHISAQVIDDVAGTTLAAASSTEPALRQAAGATTAGAREVATLLATRCADKGITTVVFDRGGNLYHGRVAAFADALRAGGLDF
jgi:large subunit ribosomal protein L18